MKNNKLIYTFLLSFFLSIFMFTENNAQNIFTGDVLLENQAQITAFGANNYTEITGNLVVKEDGSQDITDLSSLITLTKIGGLLEIHRNRSLINLNGLDNISSVENILILQNPLLTNMDGLKSITAVNGFITIESNIALKNVSGLANITSIGSDLEIVGNGKLRHIDGLSKIITIDGSLSIHHSDITNLDALGNIISIGGDLSIIDNRFLNYFCALSPLLDGGGLAGAYNVSGNFRNPIMAEIIADGICDPSTACFRDVLLATQAEVDAFSCTEITGNLAIIAIDFDITDLTPLLTLTSIGGDLSVSGIQATSLNGLNNITFVGGNLEIDQNFNITNIDELSSISVIGKDIYFERNTALLNVDGLIGIKAVNGELSFFRNHALTNVDGLKNITSISGTLDLFDNLLTNLDGLKSLKTIGATCEINRHFVLENIDGLSNLTSVGEDLILHNNQSLTSIDGLSNLTSVGGNLRVTANTLVDRFCGLFSLLNGGGLAGTYSVSFNLTNPTMAEIIADGPCGGMPMTKTISYKVTLPDCDNPGNNLVVSTGNFKEGESFMFPAYQLPSQYSAYQPYYNAFVNAEFGIPEGSLIEDIQIIINLEGICENGLIDNPETKEFLELFFLSVEIIGVNSGTHSPFEYYYFENEKEAYLKLMQENISPIMDLLNFDTDELIPFFTVNGLNPDFEGIRKVEDATYYTIYARHFSEVKLGVPTSVTGVDDLMNEVPTEYSLNQNYPNPFNPSTSISYSIPSDGHVTLAIHDVLGNEVANLENGYKSAGSYSQSFDASNLTSGIYFYTIRSGKFIETKKMLLMK